MVTNQELLNELVTHQLAIEMIAALIATQTNEDHLTESVQRLPRIFRNLREASTKLITAMNLTQQWIHYTGGLN
jgi:hypothetical protein